MQPIKMKIKNHYAGNRRKHTRNGDIMGSSMFEKNNHAEGCVDEFARSTETANKHPKRARTENILPTNKDSSTKKKNLKSKGGDEFKFHRHKKNNDATVTATAIVQVMKRGRISARTILSLPIENILKFLQYDSYTLFTSTCALMLNKSSRDEELIALGARLCREWMYVDLQWDTRAIQSEKENKWITQVFSKHSKSKEHGNWKAISEQIFNMASLLNKSHFKDWSAAPKSDTKTKSSSLLPQEVVWFNGFPRPELSTNFEVSVAVPRWAHHGWNLYLRLRYAENLTQVLKESQRILLQDVPLVSLLLAYTAAKLDGAITEQRLEDLLNEFLPTHKLVEDEEKATINWSEPKVEVVRQLFTEFYVILFDHSPKGYPNTSIVHDNSFFFVELFSSFFTQDKKQQQQIAVQYFDMKTDPEVVKQLDFHPMLTAIACCAVIVQKGPSYPGSNLPRIVKHLSGLCGREEGIFSTIETATRWQKNKEVEALRELDRQEQNDSSSRSRRLKRSVHFVKKLVTDAFTSPLMNTVRNRLVSAPLPPRKILP